MEGTVIAPPKKKKNIAVIIAVIVAIAVLLGGVALVLFNTVFNRLDVTKYVDVKIVGDYDTMAYAVVEVDYYGIAKELKFEELKDIKKYKNLVEEGECSWEALPDQKKELEREYDLDLDEIADLVKAIRINVENGEDLSNGDSVLVTIKIRNSADFKKKLIGGEIEKSVNGLAVLENYAFDLICTFSGKNGEGYFSYTLTNDQIGNEYLDYDVNIENNGYLSNGDVVEVTLEIGNYEYYSNVAAANGYALPETYTMEVTVSGLYEPLTLDQMDAVMVNKFADHIYTTNGYDFPSGGEYYIRAYYVQDPAQLAGEDYTNYLVLAYYFPSGGRTYNHVRAYANPYLDAEGTPKYEGSREHILSGNGWNNSQIDMYVSGYFSSDYSIIELDVEVPEVTPAE